MYFGTDGIRGIAGSELTTATAEKLGNALGRKAKLIVIGRDTRTSGDLLACAFSVGAMSAGANVIDAGVLPTAAVALLTCDKGADYGVMISASHNPPEYNGLKVFDRNGHKLSEEEEAAVEASFASGVLTKKFGSYKYDNTLSKLYIKHLSEVTQITFDGLKVCLDASNGAAYKVSPTIFKKLGAEVYTTACAGTGEKINDGCGSLHIENLICEMKTCGADVGFAFDGDADRIIAVDKNLTVFDGDKLIYILAKYLKAKKQLKNNTVVGTSHTNSGICRALEKHKINMIRTDIGDKYVIEAMENMNLSLGGEQSGHIILSQYATTGDGVLTAIKLTEIIKETGKSLTELFDAKLYPQENRTYVTGDRMRIINSEIVSSAVDSVLKNISLGGRVMVRASGTEPKIRIMVECADEKECRKYADELLKVMQTFEKR